MDIRALSQRTATRPVWVSYGFVAVVLVLVGVLHLGFPFIAALFAYLALTKLNFIRRRGRWLPVLIFIVTCCGLCVWLGLRHKPSRPSFARGRRECDSISYPVS